MTAAPVIDAEDLNRAVEVVRAMAYGHRLHILVLLGRADETPASLADALSVHSTVISRHLRDLVSVGLIRRRRNGRRVYYSLSGAPTRSLLAEVLRHAAG